MQVFKHHEQAGVSGETSQQLQLGGCGCAAAFFGAAKLQSNGAEPSSLGPLLAGVAMIVTLVVHQYRSRSPLMPVRKLATTFPVCGILAAMCASAAAFGLMELILTALQGKSSPGHTALLFLPEFGGLQAPDLERWAGGESAWTSPPLLGRLRQPSAAREHAHRPSAADADARSGRV